MTSAVLVTFHSFSAAPLGQTVVLDNRSSNNGVVSSELCAKAVPDGYTICVGNSGTPTFSSRARYSSRCERELLVT